MASIRTPGKINDHTTLIDACMYGVAGTSAVYLVEAGKKCLIDAGGPDGSARILRTLKGIDAFPPDHVVLTHAHWDHCQGLPDLQKRSHTIDVHAGKESIPLLEDQSWNHDLEGRKRFQSIRGVHPLLDGDVIDLDGLTLRVIDSPGHIKGHIALLDERNGNLFAGDSIGYNFGAMSLIPPFVAPYWDQEAYYATLERFRSIEFESLSLGHFGYIHGDEARQLLDEAEESCKMWWSIFERVEQEGRLDDTKYLTAVIIDETGIEVPDLKLERISLRMGLGLVNFSRTLVRKPRLSSGDLLLPLLLQMLVNGYMSSKGME